MKNKTLSLSYRAGALAVAFSAAALTLTGCGVTAANLAAPIKTSGVPLTGNVHGGQQPVSGSTIQLYAASTAGYGNASYSLLTTTVTSDANGGFNISGDYTCPSSASQVYITASGGNPGMASGTNNTAIAMMAALGSCGNLATTSFITINELTTVASVYALAPFMSSMSGVGASASNASGIANAFGAVNKLASIATGATPGPAAGSATIPTTELNTLADILAACINSAGGTAGDGSTCGSLFTLTTPTGGTAPTNTINALLNITKAPSRNVTALRALVNATPPFQPTLTSATDFTVAIKYKTGGFSTPSASAIDASGNVWITNSGNASVSVVNYNGAPLYGSPITSASLAGPDGIAIDASGAAWVTSRNSTSLTFIAPTSTGFTTSQFSLSLNAPTGIAIDAQGTLWVTNSGNSTITSIPTAGANPGAPTVFSTNVTTPNAVAINPN